MSILDKLREKAESVAQEGLEKLGVNYHPHLDALNDDDPDTQSRDLLDIYKEMTEKWNARGMMPVPDKWRSQLIAEAQKYCVGNTSALEDVRTWCEDRNAFFDDSKEPEPAALRLEMFELLMRAGVVQKAGKQRCRSVQAAARAQKRVCYNLLYQADRQVSADSLDDWISAMNDRLAAFDIAVEQPVPGRLSVVDLVFEF